MDRELLDRARAGDVEAFELIVLAKGEPGRSLISLRLP
jgi:hypothetical protein